MNYFKLSENQNISVPKKANNPAILDTVHNYAYTVKWNYTFTDNDTVFSIGKAVPADLGDAEYVINVTEEGAYARGKDYKSAVKGFLSLLEMIFCYGKNDYRIETLSVRDSAKIPFRAIHICLFPEYSLNTIRKVVRTCGMAKYTHVILETWGSIELDTLKELAWPNALTKDEIRELVGEANALGMEVIPFFQHLGHAALARMGYAGKHTVLDQNLALEHLYYPKSYGWVWNFKNPEVKALLKSVRSELCDLFGEGEYFHLGCDEAGMEFDADELCDWLREVQDDLSEKGRRGIIWGDMLLSNDFFPDEPKDPNHPWRIAYGCNSTKEYAEKLLTSLDKRLIVADWQYDAVSAPWKTTSKIREYGFDVICCPWEIHENIPAAVSTAETEGCLGIMETTWNKLIVSPGVQNIVFAGLCAFGEKSFEYWHDSITDRAYNIFRRVAPEGKTYETSGWAEKQV